MNLKKIDSILKLSSEERYAYFIRKVADFEEVWGLYDNGWALMGDDEKNEVFPFWPEFEFAQLCARDKWTSYKPKSIDVYSFLEKWLTGMQRENKNIGVFYIPQGKGIIISAKKLEVDLKEELSQYE